MVLVSAITIHGGQKFEATFEVLQIEEIADTLAPPPLAAELVMRYPRLLNAPI
jgi:hypothetical protein